jgi:MYXO-CTERM domain-containing protein
MKDSTSNANHGTATGLASVAGQVGSGISLDGSTGYMAFNSGSSLSTPSGGSFTYSTWVKTGDDAGAILSSRSSTDGGNLVIDLMVGYDGVTTNSGKLMVLIRDDAGGGLVEIPGGTINDNTWHYVTLTRSGSTIQLYLDTMSQGTATSSTGSLTSNLRAIGRESRWVQDSYTTTANEYLSGTIDEFRASNSVRSIDWITTDYNNQSSPATFLSLGSETATTSTTEVKVASFDATETCVGTTTLAWHTTYEVDTLGFNVYRQEGGNRVQLNSSLIYAQGLTGGGGYQYGLVDQGLPDPARTYWLEDVGLDLQSDWYGPVAPKSDPGCAVSSPDPIAPPPAGTPLAPQASAAGADGQGGCSLGSASPKPGWSVLLALLALTLRRRRSRPGSGRHSS